MFDSLGTFVPTKDLKVFSYPSSGFYKYTIQDPSDSIYRLSRYMKFSKESLTDYIHKIYTSIQSDLVFSSLLKGPWLPFVMPQSVNNDIGSRLEQELLPVLHQSFTSLYPAQHFKAVIQDNIQLAGRLLPRIKTCYQKFVASNQDSTLVGIYFPNCFNQYSVSSQISAFTRLPNLPTHLNSCLSGPLEIASSLIGAPNFLIHSDSYSPVLIASGSQHSDERLVPCFKSYGQHLEFWVLTNKLTLNVEQLSEQWTGGLSLYMQI